LQESAQAVESQLGVSFGVSDPLPHEAIANIPVIVNKIMNFFILFGWVLVLVEYFGVEPKSFKRLTYVNKTNLYVNIRKNCENVIRNKKTY
jgi:hypothetical protein